MAELDGNIQKLQIEDILQGKFDDYLLKNSDIILALEKRLSIKKFNDEGNRLVNLLKEDITRKDMRFLPAITGIKRRNELIHLEEFRVYINHKGNRRGFKAVFSTSSEKIIFWKKIHPEYWDICKIIVKRGTETLISKRKNRFNFFADSKEYYVEEDEEYFEETESENSDTEGDFFRDIKAYSDSDDEEEKDCFEEICNNERSLFMDIIFCLAKVLKISKDIDYWEFGEVYDCHDSEHSCRQEFLYENKNLLTA